MRLARIVLGIAVLGVFLAASLPSRDAEAKFVVGGYARIVKCVENCQEGSLFTFGGELGGGFSALGIRYGFKDDVHHLIPDLRFFYDFGLPFNLEVTPMLEFSPALAFHPGDAKSIELVLRPGVRVGWSPVSFVAIFVEPILWDISVWSKTWGSGFSRTSTTVAQRYNFGFGAQFRF
ncbi:MAG: hypothetical protein FJ087_11930 [Deltaproteobacteria bacterium]|nr:hypothetical protein [Deltaproteobacteria bacterium]